MARALDCLRIDVRYDIKSGEFSVGGTVRAGCCYDLIAEFLKVQTGRAQDHSKPNERDVYDISLYLNLDGDIFRSESDIGNLALRDGILWDVLGRWSERSRAA